MKKSALASFVLLIPILGGLAWSYTLRPHAPTAKPAKPPPLVSVARVQVREQPLRLPVQGYVTPLNQVEIRPQVGGTLLGVHFREGELVRAGQLLFTIDAANAAAGLKRARAHVAQVTAELTDARRQHARSLEMARAGFIASSAVDTVASRVDDLQAQLAGAQAEVESAQVTLGQTRIIAPISGRTGAVNVHQGSLVQAGAADPLATIVQLDPIGVAFSLPEAQLAALRGAQAAGRATVALADTQHTDGRLVFIDAGIDRASGTVAVKASFANADHALWPGAFVRVQVGAGTAPAAALLPPHAIFDSTEGKYVLLMGADGKVERHSVRLVQIEDQQALVTGLSEGAPVIVEGGRGLRPGQAVRLAGNTGSNTP